MLPSRKSNKRKSPAATSASSSSLSSASGAAAAANSAADAATIAKKPVTYGSNSRRLLQHLNIFAHSAADDNRASTSDSEEPAATATAAPTTAEQSRRRTTAQLLLAPRAHKQQRPPRSPSPLVQATSRQVQHAGASVISPESTAHSPASSIISGAAVAAPADRVGETQREILLPRQSRKAAGSSQPDEVAAGDQRGKDGIGAYTTTTADGNEHRASLRESSTIDTVMTTADPSPEDVETVSAFTGVAPALARRYLKVSGSWCACANMIVPQPRMRSLRF